MSKYTWDEKCTFEGIVSELACGVETMDEDEYQALYDELPPEYQAQVRANELQFADDSIGDESWRSDW